jgi:adenosylhomocysteine nucleosidase
VARAGAALGIPFVVLRAIADPAVRDLPPAALVPLRMDGNPDVGQVFASLLRRPHQLPSLLALAREARFALQALVAPAYALRGALARN